MDEVGLRVTLGAETPAARPLRSIEAVLGHAGRPRLRAAHEGERDGDREQGRAGVAAGCLRLAFRPFGGGFASHRTTFLTGSGTEHRVIRLPDECIMS
jgi:hypothetical protein